jgi:diguanylate cyclase (GGDEF)-like protein/PAS domain S-box-containing protein
VTRTSVVPISDNEIDNVIRGLLDRLVDTLTAATFSPQPAAGIGARLGEQGFAGEHSLGHTVEILGHGLPALAELSNVEGLTGKVISLLGVLASGYTTALRRRILDQQDDVKQALLQARQTAELERWASEARFRAVFDSAPLGMAISGLGGRITQTNGALVNILRYLPAELTGREVRDLFHPDDAAPLSAAYQELITGQRPDFRDRVKLRNAKGDTIWASLAVSVLRDAQGTPTHHVTMVEDVTDTHLLEEHLRHQTLHDVLTGLPNQEYFWIRLKAVLERADPGATVTLCKIDLDGFAVVNIGHGHEAGDLVLQEVAVRLQRLITEEQAMVARFGADEFAILIEDSPTTPAATAFAAAVNAELAEPIYLGSCGVAVSAGVGVIRRTARGIEATELVRAANAALHRAKRTGRGQWEPDDLTADAQDQARYALAASMPGAWENGEVTLCYQPVVRLDPAAGDTGRIVAVQTLLQWDHPRHSRLTPQDCAQLAEQTGLIISLGPWMVRQACRQLRVWRDQLGAAAPPVRVDLTAHLACDPDLMAVLRDALKSSGLPPQDLQLGIPVELVVTGCGDTEENLRALADAGVWTVLTRYGQAMGNLATLEHQQVRAVDITDALVRIVAQQPDSIVRDAVTAMVPLIRRTGTAVVVAGIDTPEQADWWRQIGADSARGAAFAPPCPPEEIPALLI